MPENTDPTTVHTEKFHALALAVAECPPANDARGNYGRLLEAATALVQEGHDPNLGRRFAVIVLPSANYNDAPRYVVADLAVHFGPSRNAAQYVGEATFYDAARWIAEALEAHPDPSEAPTDPDREPF